MNFFRKLLGSNTGISSKRFIGLSSCAIIYIIAFVDLFTDRTVSDYVFDGLIWLAIGGIFGITAEKFADVIDKSRHTKSDKSDDLEIDKSKAPPEDPE